MASLTDQKAEEITSIAGKRGFFFQTAEIYGGKAGFFTYGHLGKLIKNRLENAWRSYFLNEDNFYEIQSNNILPEEVFIASGHAENFNDPLTECRACHFRFRADQFLEDKKLSAEGLSLDEMTGVINSNKLRCPRCGGELSEVKWFNMMFSVPIGFAGERGYLSPETAQAAYISFKQEFEATRKQLPLGLAIIDKAYRNEISPRQLFFRLREFTQAELQIFFDPEKIDVISDEQWNSIKDKTLILKPAKQDEIKKMKAAEAHASLKLPKLYLLQMSKIQEFYLSVLNIPESKFRFRELSEEERAFYNKIHWDIELDIETLNGFKEVAGLHYRGNHDLTGHAKQSKKNLEIFYENKKFIPHVLELSFGIDRNVWALLDMFYRKEKAAEEDRSLFAFPNTLAPFTVAVFPLVSKDGLDEKAQAVYAQLRVPKFYDDSGSIGRRYRRQDEIGTPYCITIDYDTLKDNTVTIRERDSMKQRRIAIADIHKEW